MTCTSGSTLLVAGLIGLFLSWLILLRLVPEKVEPIQRGILLRAFRVRQWLVPIAIILVVTLSLFIHIIIVGNAWNISIYDTLHLFIINSNTEIIPKGAPVCSYDAYWTLRFIAPVLAATGILGLIAEKLMDRPIVFARDHIVVAGLGQMGTALCESLTESWKDGGSTQTVVAIEKDRDNPNIPRLRSRGVTVVIGDATEAITLRQARVAQAKHFVSVLESDLLNIESGAAAVATLPISNKDNEAQPTKQKKADRCWAKIHVASPELRKATPKLLRERIARETPNIDQLIDPFSAYEKVAEALLAKHRPDDDDRNQIIVIAGLGKLGRALLNLIMANYRQTKIWIIDPILHDTRSEEVLSSDSFEQVQKILQPKTSHSRMGSEGLKNVQTYLQERIEIMPQNMLSRAVGARLIDAQSQGQEIHFFICTDNDIANLNFAEKISGFLTQQSSEKSVAVVTRVFHDSFSPDHRLNGGDNPTASAYRDYHLFTFSGQIRELCSDKMILFKPERDKKDEDSLAPKTESQPNQNNPQETVSV